MMTTKILNKRVCPSCLAPMKAKQETCTCGYDVFYMPTIGELLDTQIRHDEFNNVTLNKWTQMVWRLAQDVLRDEMEAEE